jgi:hypothetical protein
MTRRISPWWYALPVGLAVVSVLAGGVLAGIQLGGAASTVVARLDQIEPFTDGQARVVLEPGERRVIAAGLPWDQRPSSLDVRCRAAAVQGQQPPVLEPVTPTSQDDLRIEVDGRYWWPMYTVVAMGSGEVTFQCVAGETETSFAVAPWFRASDFADYGVAGAVALAAAGLGLLLAAAAAVVVVVLQLTHRDRTTVVPQ